MGIMISSELGARINARLKELPEFSGHPMGVADLATKLGALPLLLDMGGLYGLRPNGDVVSIAWDAEEDAKIETDPRIVDIALFAGSERYPELAPLLPVRTSTSPVCPHCGGTGVPRAVAEYPALRNIRCWFGGLGGFLSHGLRRMNETRDNNKMQQPKLGQATGLRC